MTCKSCGVVQKGGNFENYVGKKHDNIDYIPIIKDKNVLATNIDG